MIGEAKDFIVTARAKEIKLDHIQFQDQFPVIFWDVFGEAGPSHARHHFRDGPAVAVAAART
jgi:hypothetical protein